MLIHFVSLTRGATIESSLLPGDADMLTTAGWLIIISTSLSYSSRFAYSWDGMVKLALADWNSWESCSFDSTPTYWVSINLFEKDLSYFSGNEPFDNSFYTNKMLVRGLSFLLCLLLSLRCLVFSIFRAILILFRSGRERSILYLICSKRVSSRSQPASTSRSMISQIFQMMSVSFSNLSLD